MSYKSAATLQWWIFLWSILQFFYPSNIWAWNNSRCRRVTFSCQALHKQRFHLCSQHQRVGRVCFKAKRVQRGRSCPYLTKPGQAGHRKDLSSLLGKGTWFEGETGQEMLGGALHCRRAGTGLPWPQLARGNALIAFVIQERRRNEKGRAFLFPGLYLWVPRALRCGQAECDNIPEEAGEAVVRLGAIQLLLLLN